jgi:hypothetical protein
MRRMLLLAVLLSGCVAQRAQEASRDAQTKRVGLSKEQVLACAGAGERVGQRIVCLNSEAQGSLPPTQQALACMVPYRLAERVGCVNSEGRHSW